MENPRRTSQWLKVDSCGLYWVPFRFSSFHPLLGTVGTAAWQNKEKPPSLTTEVWLSFMMSEILINEFFSHTQTMSVPSTAQASWHWRRCSWGGFDGSLRYFDMDEELWCIVANADWTENTWASPETHSGWCWPLPELRVYLESLDSVQFRYFKPVPQGMTDVAGAEPSAALRIGLTVLWNKQVVWKCIVAKVVEGSQMAPGWLWWTPL